MDQLRVAGCSWQEPGLRTRKREWGGAQGLAGRRAGRGICAKHTEQWNWFKSYVIKLLIPSRLHAEALMIIGDTHRRTSMHRDGLVQALHTRPGITHKARAQALCTRLELTRATSAALRAVVNGILDRAGGTDISGRRPLWATERRATPLLPAP